MSTIIQALPGWAILEEAADGTLSEQPIIAWSIDEGLVAWPVTVEPTDTAASREMVWKAPGGRMFVPADGIEIPSERKALEYYADAKLTPQQIGLPMEEDDGHDAA